MSGVSGESKTVAYATTAGIDASASLIDIARERNPNSDIELGSMFELPWGDNSFDTIISINGIWGGCEAALVEARRVLKPGGRIGISFWGEGTPNDLRGSFKAFARHAPQQHFRSMKKLNNIAAPGVAEEMLTDADLAWRAVSSVGPAAPALRHTDPAIVKETVLEAIRPCRDSSGVSERLGCS